MGDMADMALDDCEDDEYNRMEYLKGNMDDEEAYDRGIIDDLGFYEEY